MGRTSNAVMVELEAAIGAEYRPGDRLPAEPELAAAYGVSRATMREALQALAASGLVRRMHGVGTFVASVSTKVESALDVDLGVTEAVQATGKRLGVQVLQAAETSAPREVAERLGLPPASRVAARARRPYESGSVYRFLEDDCGVELLGGSATVTAVQADRRVAGVLRVAPGDAVLRITQVEHATDDAAVLYSEEHYVPNLFDLTIRRTRRGRSA
jgi:DNA-binding GntR family transcriptional regulator